MLPPVALVAADSDGDGHTDLAVANGTNSRIDLLFGDGRGGFRPWLIPGGGGGAVALAAVDLNRDGNLDLAWVGADGLVLHAGDGSGHFAAAARFDLGGAPSGPLLAGDFDGDGQADLLLTVGAGTAGPGMIIEVRGE